MCVIALCETARPSERMVEQMWNTNKDGMGIAWRGRDVNNNPIVEWEKGVMKLDDAKALCATAPLPFVAHFRIASIGGVCPQLTHPFPITRGVELELTGQSQNYLLFHNGHWSDWGSLVLSTALKAGIELPFGREWSDSRAMAYLSTVYGLSFMDFISEKGIAFGPTDEYVYEGKQGWKEVEGIYVSNDFFTSRGVAANNYHAGYNYHTPQSSKSTDYCSAQYCWNKDLDTDGRCKMHPLNPGTKPATTAEPGGVQRVDPFPQQQQSPMTPSKLARAGKVIPLEEAEQLFSKGEISKQQLKLVRRYHTGTASQTYHPPS